jgi:hypothetical protein
MPGPHRVHISIDHHASGSSCVQSRAVNGTDAIATNRSLLSLFQVDAAHEPIPTLTAALVQVLWVQTMLPRIGRAGVIAALVELLVPRAQIAAGAHQDSIGRRQPGTCVVPRVDLQRDAPHESGTRPHRHLRCQKDAAIASSRPRHRRAGVQQRAAPRIRAEFSARTAGVHYLFSNYLAANWTAGKRSWFAGGRITRPRAVR